MARIGKRMIPFFIRRRLLYTGMDSIGDDNTDTNRARVRPKTLEERSSPNLINEPKIVSVEKVGPCSESSGLGAEQICSILGRYISIRSEEAREVFIP